VTDETTHRDAGLKVLLVTCSALSPQGLAIAYDETEQHLRSALGEKPVSATWPGWVKLAFDDNLLRAWGDAVERSFGGSKVHATLPHPELDGLLAIVEGYGARRAISALEVFVLVDQNDPRHDGAVRLLQEWVTRIGRGLVVDSSPLGNRLQLRTIEVGHTTADGTQVSVLDEKSIGALSVSDAHAAEQKFIEQVARELSAPTVDAQAFYSIKTGSSLAKHSLAQAAILAEATQRSTFGAGTKGSTAGGLPRRARPLLRGVDATGAVHALGPFSVASQVSHSGLHHRFNRAVTLSLTDTMTHDEKVMVIDQESLGGYLEESSTTPGELVVTQSAWRLVEAYDVYDGAPFSACVSLLYRRGAFGFASRLAWLIEHWHRNRIWRTNLAPEMVLHDEVHSQAVDRHVASIVEPMLAARTFTAEEVYHLALAAWLHDWGHASGGTVGLAPVAPKDVRDLHGILTARRVKVEELQNHHELDEVEAKWVAVLSAHHQGWTSSDDEMPATSRGAELFGLWALPFKSDFENAFATRGVALAQAFERAQAMLAVLRVADGADVGKHRVPHRLGLMGSNVDEWSSSFNIWYSTMRALDSKNLPLSEAFVTLFDSRTVTSILNPATSPDEILRVVKDFPLKKAACLANLEPSPFAPIWSDTVDGALAYLLQLRKQEDYFASHDLIASVHLVPRKLEGGIEIVPYIRPAAGAAPEKALMIVDKDVQKELWGDAGVSEAEQNHEAARRAGLRAALKQRGVTFGKPRILKKG